MADATVGFLLSTLKELVEEHAQVIKDATGNIKNMQKDLLEFNAFLQDSVEKRRDNDNQTQQKIKEIREVVYKMEDIIDSYVNKIRANRSSSFLPKWLKSTVDLHSIGDEVGKVSKSIDKARKDIGIITGQRHNNTSHKSEERPPRKKDVVGFQDVFDDLKARMLRESEHFEVTSLIGMLGLGKTTLAWKVFQDLDIIHKFPIRIWLVVSQEFSERDIFLSLLKEFTPITDDINLKKDHEIADLVKAHLETGSFLIVMDDVWKPEHWAKINTALPDYNNRGKVLITSRHENVGKSASRLDCVKNLRYFDIEESWELLRLEALHSLECPTELVGVGRMIAANCKGLPLAVVIIGGILAQKFNTNISTMVKEWKNVSAGPGVTTYLNENDPEQRMKKLISLSFDNLPYHLRSCFLYLGMFPEDYEIPASKLIRLWIAEGFIQKQESCSLEETAKKCLDELIYRNLLKSEKFRHDGNVKTCRIHDTLRDFCRTEAANENLVKEIKNVEGKFDPPVPKIDEYRRLAVHSKCLEFISQKPSCHHARSFVCFSKDKVVVSAQNSTNIFGAFKFLKVLDVEPFKFDKIDTDLYQLVYMKYLVLSTDLSILPSKFSQLWNLQTVIIQTSSRELQVKADIWKMNKLRYFKTNASAILPKPGKSSEQSKELETLSTISVESCTAELFSHASNIKKLGVRGDLGVLLDGKVASFDSFVKLELIEKLKLIHDVYPYPCRDKPMPRLPQSHQFPSGLTSLTLVATFLKWDFIYIIGELKKLEVLKLKNEAFMGTTWTVDGAFEHLQLLHIEDTDLIIWEASAIHFPRLRSLVLRNCEKLLKVPIVLADIQSLQTLELYTCKPAAASAREIAAKIKAQAEGSAFTLSIFPPTD